MQKRSQLSKRLTRKLMALHEDPKKILAEHMEKIRSQHIQVVEEALSPFWAWRLPRY